MDETILVVGSSQITDPKGGLGGMGRGATMVGGAVLTCWVQVS